MPIARFQLPDGKIARFEVAQGTTPEQAQTMFDEFMVRKQQGDADMQRMADPTGSFTENLIAGAGRGADQLLLGGKQLLSGIPGLNKLSALRTERVEADIASAKVTDQPLMGTVGGQVGNVVGTIAAAAPAMLVPGAQSVAGSAITGATLGALEPAGSAKERALNVTLGGAGGAAGPVIAKKIGGAIGSRLAARADERAVAQADNAVRDAILAEARAKGLVVPAAQINPTFANRAVESIGGKVNTEMAASAANQKIFNSLAREELGLRPNAPLTAKTLELVRETAAQPYVMLKKIEDFNWTPEFRKTLTRVLEEHSSKLPAFANKEVERLARSLDSKGSFTGEELLGYLKKLRFQASSNFLARDNPAKLELAQAQRKIAGAVEDLIEQNLSDKGGQQAAKFLDQFRDARQKIAKTYDIQNAFKATAGGDVLASELAKAQAGGEKLSGNLKIMADFAEQFGKAAQEVKGSIGTGPRDVLSTVAGSALGGFPGAVVGALTPSATRATALSRPFQALMATPSYTERPSLRAAGSAANSEIFRRLAGPATAAGLLANAPEEEPAQSSFRKLAY